MASVQPRRPGELTRPQQQQQHQHQHQQREGAPRTLVPVTAWKPSKTTSIPRVDEHHHFSRPELVPWLDASIHAHAAPWHGFTFPDRRFVPLAMYLEQVTVLFLNACNVRSQAFLEAVLHRYVAPTLHVNKAEGFQSLSREAYVRGKVDMWATTPLFRLHPRLTTAFVEESKGRAHVFSTNSITGVVTHRPELTREEVTVNHFERRKSGEWICTKFESVRGPGHWTFEVGHVD